MAWFAPFTFTAGNGLTADEVNKYLYHNMQETLIGKLKGGAIPTTPEQFFGTNGVNSIVGRQIVTDNTNGIGERTSTSYGTPTTSSFGFVNPSISVVTGTRALVIWGSSLQLTANGDADSDEQAALASVAVSGASTLAASDNYAVRNSGIYPNQPTGFDIGTHIRRFSTFRWYTNLNPGTNTFTMHYRSTESGTLVVARATYLIVIPFG